MLPAKFALSGPLSTREPPPCRGRGYLGRIRKRPFRILIKLSAKKIYQRLTQWRRKVQVALGSNEVSDRLLLNALYPVVDVSAVIHRQQGSDKASFYWCDNYRESMVRTVEGRY